MQYKTIENDVENEIVEKKSKFIANIFYVKTLKEAEEKISDVKKKYHDAKHHCFAFRIHEESNTLNRFSDDGEPSGTAGSPILNILEKNNIENVIVIVTRYFGGILLGTGGLLRAYTGATLKAMEKVKLATEEDGMELLIKTSYKYLEDIQYYCIKNNIKILNGKFDENVKVIVELSIDEKDKILKDLESKIMDYEVLKRKNIRKSIEK